MKKNYKPKNNIYRSAWNGDGTALSIVIIFSFIVVIVGLILLSLLSNHLFPDSLNPDNIRSSFSPPIDQGVTEP